MFRILWAEDESDQYDDYSRILGKFLEARGLRFELMRAVDGNAVYKYLAPSVSVDLLIVDIKMPHWDGLQAARDVGAKFKGLPILVVSAHAGREEVKSELDELLFAGVIEGYFHSDDVKGWCEAVVRSIEGRPITILHLSDIHFGKFYGLREVDIMLEELICAQIEPMIRPSKIDLVVISGDFCSEGLSSEFKRALRFLGVLSDCLGVSRDKVLLVPGNHDIFRKEEEGRRLKKFVEFLNYFYAASPAALARYPELYDVRSGRLREESFGADALYSLSVYDDLRIAVIGLNSVILREEMWDNGDISASQLLKAEIELGKLGSPRDGFFRMAIFHHHLFEVPSIYPNNSEDRAVLNQGLILRHLIRHGVRLILHGHSHYASGYKYLPFFFDDPRREPIFVLSTGTLSGSHRATAQYSYQCNLLRLLRDENSIFRGVVTPLRLVDDALEWRALPAIEFDLAL